MPLAGYPALQYLQSGRVSRFSTRGRIGLHRPFPRLPRGGGFQLAEEPEVPDRRACPVRRLLPKPQTLGQPRLLDGQVQSWQTGDEYSATQTYFVTVDSWDRLKRHFASRLLREPKRFGLAESPEGHPVIPGPSRRDAMTSHDPTRRDVLRWGALGAASAMLPGAFAAGSKRPRGKAEACIFLWLGGGAAQIDTFDPKRRGDGKKKPGSYYDAIPTAIPGERVVRAPRAGGRSARPLRARPIAAPRGHRRARRGDQPAAHRAAGQRDGDVSVHRLDRRPRATRRKAGCRPTWSSATRTSAAGRASSARSTATST